MFDISTSAAACRRGCSIFGAITGLLIWLFCWLSPYSGFWAGVVMGVLGGFLIAGLLRWGLCEGRQVQPDGRSQPLGRAMMAANVLGDHAQNVFSDRPVGSTAKQHAATGKGAQDTEGDVVGTTAATGVAASAASSGFAPAAVYAPVPPAGADAALDAAAAEEEGDDVADADAAVVQAARAAGPIGETADAGTAAADARAAAMENRDVTREDEAAALDADEALPSPLGAEVYEQPLAAGKAGQGDAAARPAGLMSTDAATSEKPAKTKPAKDKAAKAKPGKSDAGKAAKAKGTGDAGPKQHAAEAAPKAGSKAAPDMAVVETAAETAKAKPAKSPAKSDAKAAKQAAASEKKSDKKAEKNKKSDKKSDKKRLAAVDGGAQPKPAKTGDSEKSAAKRNRKAGAGGDDLKLIKGVGPVYERMLHELGYTTFAQVAAWTQTDIERMHEKMPNFDGRVESEDWIGQAARLAAGGKPE
ncbi:hypothetical protein [Paracoccus pacificus]|uniref:NADH-quinone oxidoreductase subunit E n=1 Tax=Paracoccus pacificus TaxID=1463598 RepID=A0ABW4RCV1_9RHOB